MWEMQYEMKFVCQFFNKNCLETGLKPDIPTINAAALEYVKRFPLFNVPAVAFSDSDFDETISAYLPYPIVKVVPLGRTPVEQRRFFRRSRIAFVFLMLMLRAIKSSTPNWKTIS